MRFLRCYRHFCKVSKLECFLEMEFSKGNVYITVNHATLSHECLMNKLMLMIEYCAKNLKKNVIHMETARTSTTPLSQRRKNKHLFGNLKLLTEV